MLYAGDFRFDEGFNFTAQGPAVPDPQGHYVEAGQHHGQPWYRHQNNTFQLYWQVAPPEWRIAVDRFDPLSGYWKNTFSLLGSYIPGLVYTGSFDVRYYSPKSFMPDVAPVNQLGGGSSARYRRLRPNEQPVPRQIQVRNAMTTAQKCWAEKMPAAMQAEWLNNNHVWHTYYGVEKFLQPYNRFCNVNLTLADAEEPLIFAHTGRRYLDVEFVSIEAASAATQLITTLTSVRQNFPHPCYTLLSYFQVWPIAVDGPRFHWYKRRLGVALAAAPPFAPGWTHIEHQWLAAYPLVEGDMTQVTLRYTSDNDEGFAPLEWAPFTLTHVSAIPEVGP